MASARQPLQRDRDNRPDWVRNLGGQAHRRWLPTSAASKVGARRAGYTVSIVVNAILLVFIQGLPTWRFPFITAAFIDVRWLLELSLSATIFANALFFAYDARWFRDLIQIALSALALRVILVLYRRFPFDFGTTSTNDLAHLLLGLLFFALVVAIFAQLIALVAYLVRRVLPGDGADTEPVGDNSIG